MGIYTVTGKLLENIQPKPYYNELLFVFTFSTNSYKVAVDTNGCILDIYRSIGEENPLIATWLQIMSNEPTNFEPIDEVLSIDTPKCFCEIFLLLASKIAGAKRLITNSIQDLSLYEFNGEKVVKYNDIDIKIYDKDDALNEFRQNMSQFHSGSGDNVAGNKIEY